MSSQHWFPGKRRVVISICRRGGFNGNGGSMREVGYLHLSPRHYPCSKMPCLLLGWGGGPVTLWLLVAFAGQFCQPLHSVQPYRAVSSGVVVVVSLSLVTCHHSSRRSWPQSASVRRNSFSPDEIEMTCCHCLKKKLGTAIDKSQKCVGTERGSIWKFTYIRHPPPPFAAGSTSRTAVWNLYSTVVGGPRARQTHWKGSCPLLRGQSGQQVTLAESGPHHPRQRTVRTRPLWAYILMNDSKVNVSPCLDDTCWKFWIFSQF